MIFRFMDGLFVMDKCQNLCNMKHKSDINLLTETEKNASKIIRNIFVDIEKCGYSRQKPFIIGAVEDRMRKYAEENSIELGSSDVYMSSHSLSHSEREHKVKIGKAVLKEDIIAFPMTRHKMDMSYDGEAFIFTDGKAKYVIHPNYAIKIDRKREKKVVFITATLLG